MNVLVNGTTLNVTNAYAERTDIITLYVIVPYSEIEYTELKTLFKENYGDILKTDNEGNTELFSGFTYVNTVDDDEKETFTVKLTASEYDFQLGRNRKLEEEKAQLEAIISAKEQEINELKSSITVQKEV